MTNPFASNEMRLVLLIVVMAGLLMFVSHLVHQYKSMAALREAKINRMRREAGTIEGLFVGLGESLLPPDVQMILKAELLKRLEAIRQISPAENGIEERIGEVRQIIERLRDGEPLGPPEAMHKGELDRMVMTLNQTRDVLLNRLRLDVSVEQIKAMGDQLVDLRAQLVFDYFSREAKRLSDQGDKYDALSMVSAVLDFFAQNGPVTHEVKRLYDAAGELRRLISAGTRFGQDAADDSTQDQVAAESSAA